MKDVSLHDLIEQSEISSPIGAQVDGAGFDESRPFVRYSEYGWSPRWQPTEAAQRIFTHLEDTAPQV